VIARVINHEHDPMTITGVEIIPDHANLEPQQMINEHHAVTWNFKKIRLEAKDSDEIPLRQQWGDAIPAGIKKMKATFVFRTSEGDKRETIILERE